MKIAFVRLRYSAIGGAERYLDELARQLVARGHEVHIFASEWKSGPGAERLTFHRVPTIRATPWLRALSFAFHCRRELERVPCDVVFSLERTLQQDIYRAAGGCHREWLAQRCRYVSAWKRLAIWLNPLHPAMLWLERQTFSPANTRQVITNSHRGRKEVIRHFGFPAERIQVIHNGVDCERFTPATRMERSEFVLLFVGTGFERKGLEFCVRVLAELPENVRLRVVGKGRRSRYEKIARKLGVSHRLEFLGHTTDMPEVYRRAHVLVHPAIYEPFANVCLEAMASGLPVVTSRINGASEVIEPGINGAAVDEPSDIGALAQAIRQFLDRKILADASTAARRTAERLPFSLNAEKTLAVIELAHAAAAAQNSGSCKTS
jgi:UDP-glucose:(heptosyl)LPS alpha-1,3-glucosyltransferase